MNFEEYRKCVRQAVYDDTICDANDFGWVVHDYLDNAHRWLEGDVITFMYANIPVDMIDTYLECIGWSYDITNNKEVDESELDPVFHRPGVVSHLYALFFQFHNLTRQQILVEVRTLLELSDGYDPEDGRWALFHSGECQLIEEGMVCSCGITWQRVISRLIGQLCQLHNQCISPLSVVWDSPSDDMVRWLPKEMMEDVVWLMEEATMDTMLVYGGATAEAMLAYI